MQKINLRGQLIFVGATLALLGYASAQAAELPPSPSNTYIVTTNTDTNDSPSCSGTALVFTCNSLRDAITAANNDTSGSPTVINFGIAASTIPLNSTLPNLQPPVSMTIDGTGQNITINGQGNQIMVINSGTVKINALTFANGSCTGECYYGYGLGGAIFVDCTVCDPTITNSTFSGNTASSGGAIYSYQPLMVTNSTFYNNSASVWGGAITCDGAYGEGGCSMTVTNGTFLSNTAPPGGGGAIYIANGGTGVLVNDILEGGAANGGNGNCGLGGPSYNDTLTDGGGNLSDDPTGTNTCNLSEGNNTSDSSLNLGGLANNGGSAETIALGNGSEAISSAAANCPLTDERDVPRPSSNCSSGALQFPVFSRTTSSTGTVAECTAPAICNLTGGDSQTVAAGTAAAAAALTGVSGDTITESVCIIAQDPRQICGAPTSAKHYTTNTTFPVSEFCPSFGDTVVPDYLCGAYSSNGPTLPFTGTPNGLAVLQGIGNPVNAIPGLLWLNDADPDVYFGFNSGGDPYASECNNIGLSVNPITGKPDGISVAWAPYSGAPVEGFIPENPRTEEVTDGCGGQKNGSGGVSITLIGVTLNLSNATQELGPGAARNSQQVDLIEFAEFKYANLLIEVAADNIPLSNKAKLLEIIGESGLFLAGGNHACAETTLYDADNYVINNAGVFLGNALDPNSYGRTRTRILNLFYTLYTRIDGPITGNPNPITNLAVSVPFPLLAPGFTPPVCSQPHL